MAGWPSIPLRKAPLVTDSGWDAAGVEHDALECCFRLEVEGLQATLDYRLEQGRIVMLGVRVPAPIEGRGLASRLTAAAVGWAEAAGLSILSQCSYVDAWLRRRRSRAGGLPR